MSLNLDRVRRFPRLIYCRGCGQPAVLWAVTDGALEREEVSPLSGRCGDPAKHNDREHGALDDGLPADQAHELLLGDLERALDDDASRAEVAALAAMLGVRPDDGSPAGPGGHRE